jgi:hypothetical protein
MIVLKTNRTLWYRVLGVKLLHTVIENPDNAYAAEIARRANDLPVLGAWYENDVRFALKALESLGLVESALKYRRLATGGAVKVRLFRVTDFGMVLLALKSEAFNIALES